MAGEIFVDPYFCFAFVVHTEDIGHGREGSEFLEQDFDALEDFLHEEEAFWLGDAHDVLEQMDSFGHNIQV
jgi:hypothetical protein